MMNKKFKGFSLAELLISLLVISIVLSAAIPAITRKAGQQRELIWRWTEQNNVAFSATGANQSVILGLDAMPMDNADLYSEHNAKKNSLMYDGSAIAEDTSDDLLKWHAVPVGRLSVSDAKMSNSGDKLSILKRKIDSGFSDFANSHISFYNMDSSADTSTAEYAGRLTMDLSSIALGKGTLLSIDPCVKNTSGTCTDTKLAGEDTAIGHYALSRNTQGYRNTAIGKKSLLNNFKGSFNTALGFASAYYQGKDEKYADADTNITDADKRGKTAAELKTLLREKQKTSSENTAIGTEAQYILNKGSYNTSLGSQAMKYLYNGYYNTAIGKRAMFGNTAESTQPSGDYNTAVGAESLVNLRNGSYNVALGSGACNNTAEGSYNICIGSNSGYNSALVKDKYALAIGGYSEETDNNSNGKINAPLLAGHTAKTVLAADASTNVTYDQELLINARRVKIQPYMGHFPIFEFEAIHGAKTGADTYANDGYSKFTYTNGQITGAETRYGVAKFNLVDSGSAGADKSIQLKITGDIETAKGKLVSIDTLNPNISDSFDNRPDIYLNKKLLIDFPKYSDDETTINIGLYDSIASLADTPVTNQALSFNNKLFVINSEDTPVLKLDADGFEVSNSSGTNETFDNFFRIKKVESSDSAIQFFFGKTSTTDGASTLTENNIFTVNKNEFKYINPSAKVEIKGNHSSKYSLGASQNVPSAELYLDAWDLSIDGIHNKYKNQTNYAYIGTSLIGLIEFMYNDLRGGTPSDLRLKNVLSDNKAGLKEINKLDVKNFTYKQDKEKTPHVGVIAQQVQKIFPNAVTKDKDGYLKIRNEDIFYAMVNSIKELFAQLQDLIAKVSGLDKRLTELESQNKLLKEQNAAYEKRFIELEKRQAAIEKKQALQK